jgi:hypothetical protein
MFRNKFNSVWDFWANLPPLLRFFIGCMLLGAISLFVVLPGYWIFKSWRLKQNLVAAQVASDEKRMDDARDLSLTVVRGGDSGIEAYRILEKSMGSLRDPRHGDIARSLMFHPKGTRQDRLTGFAGIVNKGPLGLVGQMWSVLPEELRTEAAFATLFADRLVAEKKYSEAAGVLFAAKEKEKSESLDHRLAAILIDSQRKQGYDEAQKMIVEGMFAPQADLSVWLPVLEKLSPLALDATILAPTREVISKSTGLNPASASLMLHRLDYASGAKLPAEVLESAIAQWNETNPVELIQFLTDFQFNQRIIELFPIERVTKFPALYRPLLNAFQQAGEWEKAKLLLDAHGNSMEKFEELAHRAYIAKQQGDIGQLTLAWSGAMGDAEARRMSDAFLTLSRLAEGWGMKEQSEMAMIRAIRAGLGPLPLYQDLKNFLNSLRMQGKEKDLLEICAHYLSLESSNPILLTQYAYLASMNDLADPVLAITALEPLAKAYPDQLPVQCVLANLYLLSNQPAKAAGVLDPLKIEVERLTPEFRAIYLATQVQNQRMKKNDPLILNFPMELLLPSEKKKFIALIAQAKE